MKFRSILTILICTLLYAASVSARQEVNIIAYQDEIGCVRERYPLLRLRENWKRLREIHGKAGIQMWANCESFAWEKESPVWPENRHDTFVDCILFEMEDVENAWLKIVFTADSKVYIDKIVTDVR